MREYVGRHEFKDVRETLWRFLEKYLSDLTQRKYSFLTDPTHWVPSPVAIRAASYLFTTENKKGELIHHKPDPKMIQIKIDRLRDEIENAGVFKGTEYALRQVQKEFTEEVDHYKASIEIKGSRNWLALFIAEECAVHYLKATNARILTAGKDASTSEPNGDFAKLVKVALSTEVINSVANWKTVSQTVVDDFDYDKNQVTVLK